jgi:hypothetical protein
MAVFCFLTNGGTLQLDLGWLNDLSNVIEKLKLNTIADHHTPPDIK